MRPYDQCKQAMVGEGGNGSGPSHPLAASFYRPADAGSKPWIKPNTVVMVDHSGDWFEAKVVRVGANEVEVMYRMDKSTEVIKGKHKIEKRMLASRHHASTLPPALPFSPPIVVRLFDRGAWHVGILGVAPIGHLRDAVGR